MNWNNKKGSGRLAFRKPSDPNVLGQHNPRLGNKRRSILVPLKSDKKFQAAIKRDRSQPPINEFFSKYKYTPRREMSSGRPAGSSNYSSYATSPGSSQGGMSVLGTENKKYYGISSIPKLVTVAESLAVIQEGKPESIGRRRTGISSTPAVRRVRTTPRSYHNNSFNTNGSGLSATSGQNSVHRLLDSILSPESYRSGGMSRRPNSWSATSWMSGTARPMQSPWVCRTNAEPHIEGRRQSVREIIESMMD